MDDLGGMLAPCDEPVTLTRNATELSRYAESIVRTFLEYRASEARVLHEKSPYGMQALYDGLRRVCGKVAYKGLVRAHKQNGKIYLLRERKEWR